MTAPRLVRGSVITSATLTTDTDKIKPAPAAPVQSRTVPVFADKHSMQRWAMDLEQRVHQMMVLLGSAVLGGGNLIAGISITANTLKTVAHRLNRPATSCIAVRMLPTGNWTNTWGPVLQQALPTGYTSDKYIAIEANWSGSVDLYVF